MTPPPQPAAARHAVGIDLGTSHTVVAHVPLDGGVADIALLPLAQRISAAEVQEQPLLPSTRYQAAPGELGDAWRQPWPAQDATEQTPAVIGRWARDLGAAVPGRLVASAKSWLSHAGVDRTAPILPWGAGQDVAKVSPLQASSSYLAHVRAAWDATHPDAPLAEQLVVLTVPASFDEGARALTLQAAQLAGLPRVQLLEEPKAAFHDWLVLQGSQLAEQLQDSRLVLVLDVGGGTTDLTLIRVEAAPGGGLPLLTRTAVGEHLMLGGDNMDLALAHGLEPQFAGEGQRLPAARFAQLVQRCRLAKEQLLAANAPESVAVTLLGGGSQLLAQTRSATLTRDAVRQAVVEGFLPPAQITDQPARRQGALRTLSLPYPADAAISRHLALFLAQHAAGELPDTLLLNGGVFHAHALVQRLTEQLGEWRGAPLRVLHNPHPDWAVARGAAAHGLAQYQSKKATSAYWTSANSYQNRSTPHRWRGGAQLLAGAARPGRRRAPGHLPAAARHRGGHAHGAGRPALCAAAGPAGALCAGGAQPGQAQAGQIAALDGEGWVELPPLATVLPAPEGRDTAQVRGTAAGLHERGGRAGAALRGCAGCGPVLAAAVRRARGRPSPPPSPRGRGRKTPSRPVALAPLGRGRGEGRARRATAQIDRIFGNQTQDVSPKEVRQLRATLEKTLGPRESWPLPLLRTLFDALLARAKRRRRSAEHERVWLNLAGWCLRPGLGAELDGWRLEQLWPLYAQGLGHSQEGANWTEWWVLWRRVAAGLDEAQQMQVLEDVAGRMQQTVQRGAKSRWGSYDDMLRLFAAMEAVPWQYRQEMGRWMLERLKRPDEPPHTWWAIGRLAARAPLAANAHLVMPPEAAQEFLQATLAQDWRKNEQAMFAAVQIARMTGERLLDLDEAQRARVLDKLRASGAPERWLAQVAQVQEMNAEDRRLSLGDSLPPGLVLVG